jgi:hypothetical protein
MTVGNATSPVPLGVAGERSVRKLSQLHWDAVERSGIGPYFGSAMDAGPGYSEKLWQLKPSHRDAWVDRYLPDHRPAGGKPMVMPHLVRSFIGIDWVLEHVKAAYVGAGRSERYEEIAKVVKKHDFRGLALARELQRDGWTALYFNPDVENPNDRDPADSVEHKRSKRQVDHEGTYGVGRYKIAIAPEHQLLNYRRTPVVGKDGAVSNPAPDLSAVKKLRKIPFGVLIAKQGIHTAVVVRGDVNDAHVIAAPWERDMFVQVPLENPEFKFNSGIILVPSWPE